MKKHIKKSGTIRLIGYARVSTELQRNKASIPTQRETLQQYCTYKGYELVCVEADEAISGKAMSNRPGLQQAIESILQNNQADGLVVAYMDRLSRNTKEFLELVSDFEAAGKRLVFLDCDIDTSTPTGRMVITVLMAMAQMQRESASERSIAGRAQLRKQNKNYSGKPPYGWTAVENELGSKDLVPVESEQSTLQHMKKLSDAGMNGSQITALLNRQGWMPRDGKQWDRKVVYTILKRLDEQ